MQSADREVLTAAGEWLDAGHGVYLVTVARTWGSSPRPPGSLLAVRAADGAWVGSVSGGCVEEDMAARLAAHGAHMTLPALECYGVSAEQTHRFGLPCGGRLELVVERLAGIAPLRAVLRALDERRAVLRRLCLATGEASLHPPDGVEEFRFETDNVYKLFGPTWRLLLIGAGQLSRFVAQIAEALDYEVVVCDPREDYAAAWRVPGARLDTRSPDEAVQAHAGDARSAVLALTHDPRLDDLALMEALRSPAFYVGALGSRANSARRRARLASLDLPAAAVARLHAPIGLPLGSRTPAEIAVAILAELTAVRHGVMLLPVAAEPDGERAPHAIACDPLPASC
jgi:xanthine dehydrogenase accessory factor